MTNTGICEASVWTEGRGHMLWTRGRTLCMDCRCMGGIVAAGAHKWSYEVWMGARGCNGMSVT